MSKLSTAQKRFIKAAMKKNEEISCAEHFAAKGSWNKLKKLGKPDVPLADLNEFITFERHKKRFDFSNLTPEDKQDIINTDEYAVTKRSWFDEIERIAIDLIDNADYLDDDETLMTAMTILALAQTQRENINSRPDSEEGKSEEESQLRKMAEIFKVFEE